jgi:hypothetical protein
MGASCACIDMHADHQRTALYRDEAILGKRECNATHLLEAPDVDGTPPRDGRYDEAALPVRALEDVNSAPVHACAPVCAVRVRACVRPALALAIAIRSVECGNFAMLRTGPGARCLEGRQ